MIVLRYSGRDLQTYDGLVFREAYGEHNPLETFEAMTFEDMIALLARILGEYPGEPECALQRSDVAGSVSIALDEGLTTLLRTNPSQMIDQLSYQHDSQRQKVTVRAPGPALMGGTESLRNVIGATVYVRTDQQDRYECPFCGRWADMVVDSVNIRHAACGHTITETARLPRYLGISTVRLLAQQVDRFWLPRLWTQGSQWISRAQLEEHFNNFLTNKPKE